MLMVTGMAVGANQDGRLALVAAASDEETFSGGVWHAWQTTPNGEWSGWQSLGSPSSGAGVGPPALAPNADGRLEVVVVDRADGGVWHAWQIAPNGNWSGWHPLDRPDPEIPALLSPALARDADRRLQAFVILQDGSVWCIGSSLQADGRDGNRSASLAAGQPPTRPSPRSPTLTGASRCSHQSWMSGVRGDLAPPGASNRRRLDGVVVAWDGRRWVRASWADRGPQRRRPFGGLPGGSGRVGAAPLAADPGRRLVGMVVAGQSGWWVRRYRRRGQC
jgi:hypothetical protein